MNNVWVNLFAASAFLVFSPSWFFIFSWSSLLRGLTVSDTSWMLKTFSDSFKIQNHSQLDEKQANQYIHE